MKIISFSFVATALALLYYLPQAFATEAGVETGASFAGKRIALHAQASAAKHGFVSGSVYTCLGLKNAFEAMGAAHVRIFETGFYGPVCLDEKDEGNCSRIDRSSALEEWDLVVIEGWFDMIRSFINLIRTPPRLEDSHGREIAVAQPTVLYFCLDTYSEDYLRQILGLNVDGYLTNSRRMLGLFHRAGR